MLKTKSFENQKSDLSAGQTGGLDIESAKARIALFSENSQFDSTESFLRRALERHPRMQPRERDWIAEEIFCSMRFQGRSVDSLRYAGEHQKSFGEPSSGVNIIVALCDVGLWQEAETLFADYNLDAPEKLGDENSLDAQAQKKLLDLKLKEIRLCAQSHDWRRVLRLTQESLKLVPSCDESFALSLEARFQLGETLKTLCQDANLFLEQFPETVKTNLKIISLCTQNAAEELALSYSRRLQNQDAASFSPLDAAAARVWLKTLNT